MPTRETAVQYTVVQIEARGELKEFTASVRATDSSHDLAVLQIDAPPELLKPITVDASSSPLLLSISLCTATKAKESLF